MNTETITLGIAVFWSAVGMGAIVTAMIIPFLRKVRVQKKDRKETFYGTEAVEFNAIRKTEEKSIKKRPVPRIGGLTLLPTVVFLGLCVVWLTQSILLALCIALICAAALVALYDDLLDVGIVKGNRGEYENDFFC